jgi:DNA-binding MarR family transcriptional regulator
MRLAAALSAVGTTAATIMLAVPAHADMTPISRISCTPTASTGSATTTRGCPRSPVNGSMTGAGKQAVSHQAIGAVLAVLQARGFIQRSPDPTDGRRQLISLTDAGVGQAENHIGAREEWLARVPRTDLPKTNAEQCGMRWHFSTESPNQIRQQLIKNN